MSLNKDIKNKVAISELEGKVLNMGNIFDSIAAKATIKTAIDTARFYHSEGVADSIVIKSISKELGVPLDEAKEIFEKEVLMLEIV